MTSDTWNETAVPCSNFPDNVSSFAQILSRQFRKCPHGESVSPHLQCSRLAFPIVLTIVITQDPSRLIDQHATMLGLTSENKIGVASALTLATE
jgi:hypothetical protein